MVRYSPEIESVRALVAQARSQIHQLPGVSGTGITHSSITGIAVAGAGYQLAVLIEEFDPALINLLPRTINGIGVVYKVSGIAQALQCSIDSCGCHCPPSGTFPGRYRPPQPGSSIENIADRSYPYPPNTSGGSCRVGTLGWLAFNEKGETVMISNNHVMAYDFPGFRIGRVGNPIIQPGAFDSGSDCTDKIGTLAKWVPIAESGAGVNKVDAAYGLFNSDILPVDYPPRSLCGHVISTGFDAVVPTGGENIKKCGRTTGVTKGTLDVIDYKVTISYGYGKTADFTEQFVTSPGFVDHGDSGSVVLIDEGEYCHPVGLLASGYPDGSAICNYMTNVLQALNISFTRYACSGAPDYICDGSNTGPYLSMHECLNNCTKIVPPPTQYRCTGSPDYNCAEDANGQYFSLTDCQNNCKKPPPPAKYSCTGSPDYNCVQDANGQYSSLTDCQNNCQAPDRYSCLGSPDWKCVLISGGDYATLEECRNNCKAPPPPGCTALACSIKFT